MDNDQRLSLFSVGMKNLVQPKKLTSLVLREKTTRFSFRKDRTALGFSQFASVFFNDSFYIIGGVNPVTPQNKIGQLSTIDWTWSDVGQLQTGRSNHGVIWTGGKMLVIGGCQGRKCELNVESCELENNKFTCSQVDTTPVNNPGFPPLLLLVTDHPCS